jgi:WD40 repeat protein
MVDEAGRFVVPLLAPSNPKTTATTATAAAAAKPRDGSSGKSPVAGVTGEALVAVAWYRHVRVWSIEGLEEGTEAEELAPFPEAHDDLVVSLASSRCSTLIVTGASDGAVLVWDVRAREVMYSYPLYSYTLYSYTLLIHHTRTLCSYR